MQRGSWRFAGRFTFNRCNFLRTWYKSTAVPASRKTSHPYIKPVNTMANAFLYRFRRKPLSISSRFKWLAGRVNVTELYLALTGT